LIQKNKTKTKKKIEELKKSNQQEDSQKTSRWSTLRKTDIKEIKSGSESVNSSSKEDLQSTIFSFFKFIYL
jgi:hypothetical protein